MKPNQAKLLFFVTEDWYFCSHRLALAKAARQAGFEVSVLTRLHRHGDIIRSAGINVIPLNVDRGGINPVTELRTLLQVAKVYREVKPDIVHHIALKPVLYGGIVALFMRRLKVVNLLAGLGVIFSSQRFKARLLRPWVEFLCRILFRRRNTCTIVQNKEDHEALLQRLQIDRSCVRLIKGSGVDIERFYPSPEPDGTVSVALASRLLWDKGVGEYVAAVALLKQKGLRFDAFLLGQPDSENMASVSLEDLQTWNQEGDVRWIGQVDDIAQFWRGGHVAVLPSYYGEGVPKCLIEAAACARPIVTTDTAGCHEIVEDGVNGILVPPRDINALADALEKLILDQQLRKEMGRAGRARVEQEFSDQIVLTQTLSVYQAML
ncbi:glycosyltransferase family 4 protein [Methylomonas sp. MgM2]